MCFIRENMRHMVFSLPLFTIKKRTLRKKEKKTIYLPASEIVSHYKSLFFDKFVHQLMSLSECLIFSSILYACSCL